MQSLCFSSIIWLGSSHNPRIFFDPQHKTNMPIIKSAKKALRQSHRKGAENDKRRVAFREQIKNYKGKPSEKLLALAFSSLDRAVDNKVIHKNRASRLKSNLSKLLKNS